ncbi:DUF2303 family protein [Pseudomonas sp. W5-36]|uniref:DUF2303 family protein n=1 Tax=Pseudomonas sp. W5-36 TaxID=3097455 RepID=UPI00397DC97C
MDQIGARSKKTLPAALQFHVVPFEGLTEKLITLRISVITGGPAPELKRRWIGEEVRRENIGREFKAVLEAALGSTLKLSLGSFTD